ncbi:MAG: transketolase [Coriobacteriia bacterium]|nr:transketolase [Coriobacteriia bacterium]
MAFNAEQVRQRALKMRRDIVDMITEAGSGHPGGSLSATDIMATLYFGEVLNYDANNLTWQERDRFILSKGHAAPVLYAALAQAGYFDRKELATLRKFGSRLQGHPDSRKLPGVEVSTGSLGQGISVATGLAAGLKLAAANGDSATDVDSSTDTDPSTGANSSKIPFVYALLGDGELQEGQVWEAAMFAAQQKLGNLIALIDNNNLQIDGELAEVNSPYSIEEKFKAFNWQVLTCKNGHDVEEIKAVLDEARERALKALAQGEPSSPAPTVIVFNTVKGKGVSFMENKADWHGVAPSKEQKTQALEELGA